ESRTTPVMDPCAAAAAGTRTAATTSNPSTEFRMDISFAEARDTRGIAPTGPGLTIVRRLIRPMGERRQLLPAAHAGPGAGDAPARRLYGIRRLDIASRR